MKNTLIIGASDNPERFAYKAFNMLKSYNHEVVLVGNKKNVFIDNQKIYNSIPENIKIDTVTLYINPKSQKEYYQEIINLKPQRVIFNPGTENNEFEELLERNQINFIEACTLVLLRTNQY